MKIKHNISDKYYTRELFHYVGKDPSSVGVAIFFNLHSDAFCEVLSSQGLFFLRIGELLGSFFTYLNFPEEYKRPEFRDFLVSISKKHYEAIKSFFRCIENKQPLSNKRLSFTATIQQGSKISFLGEEDCKSLGTLIHRLARLNCVGKESENSFLDTFYSKMDIGIPVFVYEDTPIKIVRMFGDIQASDFTTVKDLFLDASTKRIIIEIGDSFFINPTLNSLIRGVAKKMDVLWVCPTSKIDWINKITKKNMVFPSIKEAIK